MMTRIEFLTRRWFEVDQLRYKKLAEIRSLTGDESWMRRHNIPGNALHASSEWIGLCRMLAAGSNRKLHPDQSRDRGGARTRAISESPSCRNAGSAALARSRHSALT